MSRSTKGVTSDAFPAKAGPTVEAAASPDGCTLSFSGTGFSREEARMNAIKHAV